MPRIPSDLLDAVVYLYPDVAAAQSGEQIGGSGFLASISDGNDSFTFASRIST
jgi:hypothetical protein